MPIMETIFMTTIALTGLVKMLPASSDKTSKHPISTVAAPNTIISHATNTDGEGTNSVFNVSFVNNNGTPPLQTPTSSSSPYESTQDYLKKTFNTVRLNDIASATYDYCSENKFYLIASGLVGGYGYMFYKMRSIQSYINDHNSWSAWKHDIPLDKLLAISQEHLTHELMMAIQGRYILVENPTDSLTPLIRFSHDIAEEKELIAGYHAYISWCMKFSMHRIMPLSETLLAQLTERKQRAAYLSTLFQSWLTHYKLEKITR